jgi:hypothetical protein
MVRVSLKDLRSWRDTHRAGPENGA